jgi:hypothetical protein
VNVLRFSLYTSFITLSAFAIGGLMMMTLGSTQPVHPALDGFVEGCEGITQPCWYGIVPHVTTLDEAEILLEQANYAFDQSGALRDTYDYMDFRRPVQDGGCSSITLIYGYDLRDVLVEGVVLQLCQNVYIGDVLEAVDGRINRILISSGGGLMEIDDGQTLINFQWAANVNPYSQVEHIDLEPIYMYGIPPLVSWNGYAPSWRYCQLEPNYLSCD